MGRAATAVRIGLMQAIADEYQPGDQLPAEPELAAAYSVSRSTVREALQALEQDGVVRRIHGLGTFVNQTASRVTGALDVDLGITEAVEAANHRLGIRVLRIAEVAAPLAIAERLALPPAGRVLRIERIILADDRPAVVALDAIPTPIVARTTQTYRDGSVYRYLERDVGIVLAGGLASVTAVDADARLARLLQVGEGDALLRLEQVERDDDGSAVLYSLEHFVPDRFELTIRRLRRAGGGR